MKYEGDSYRLIGIFNSDVEANNYIEVVRQQLNNGVEKQKNKTNMIKLINLQRDAIGWGEYANNSVANSDTLNEVISDMIAREKLGLKKYGTTIDRKDYDLKNWMQHHYEELLDAALYVKKQIQILENKNK